MRWFVVRKDRIREIIGLTYVLGAIAGIVFGGIIGLLKNILVWHKYIDKKEQSSQYAEASGMYARAMISYFVNIVTLFVAFFLRNILPFDGIAFLIGTAIALAIINHVWAIKQKS